MVPQDLNRPLWRTAIVALAFLATASPVFAQRKAQNKPSEQLQPTWAWLGEAPQADDEHLIQGAGPGIAVFDTLLTEIDSTKDEDLILPGLAARLDAQLAMLPLSEREPLIEYLSAHEQLAMELAFLILPEDKTVEAYRVLARLIEAHGERVAELAPLAAAICVVHDDPKDRRVNENTVPLIDAVELFGYFAENERSMQFKHKDMPATLLVYVADTNGTLDELEWARRRYGRDRNIGNRYQEITYDTAAFRQEGAKKKVTEAGGYSLQSIQKLGGICADQAYFAMTVGKATGVPGCYVAGKGGEVSHAWLGFLDRAGSKAARWNFESGRYPQYEDVQGKVLDPQTWKRVPDANLAIAGYTTWVKPEERQASVVITDAAVRLGVVTWQRDGPEAMTQALADKQLALLERALRIDPGNVRAWMLARDRLAAPGVTLKQRERWAREIDRLAGQTSPDFAFDMFEPMFNAEPDPEVRYNLWDWAADRFGKRKDLPARARLAQVQILIEEGKPADAYETAKSIFDKYHEGGPPAMQALKIAEQLLKDRGDDRAVIDLYAWAFRQPRQPKAMKFAFLQQTVWYQVGSYYLYLLEAAGDTRQANLVRNRLPKP